MPQTLACETGFPTLATGSCGVLFSCSILLSLVRSGARLVLSDVFLHFPPSFHPVPFPRQSAWHPACLRDEETRHKAEKYIKKSALGFCFSTAKVSGTRRNIQDMKNRFERKADEGTLFLPIPTPPPNLGFPQGGNGAEKKGCMDTDGSQRGTVPCSLMHTEIQQGQRVMEGSGTWEGFECADLWKW